MRIISVISGKGGVGKTTVSAGLATLLATKGRKTLLMDMDAGMGNSEIVLGVEGHQPIQFSPDVLSVIEGDTPINDMILSDRAHDFLYYSTFSHGTIREPVHPSKLTPVLDALEQRGFEFIIADAPAGAGAETRLSMALATELIFVTTCDRSSMVDADRLMTMMRRGDHMEDFKREVSSDSVGVPAPENHESPPGLVPERSHQHRGYRSSSDQSLDSFLIINRYSAIKAEKRIIPNYKDVQGFLRLPLLGVIPECDSVIASANRAERFTESGSPAAIAADDIVNRVLGRDIPMRVEFVDPKAGVREKGKPSQSRQKYRFMNWNWIFGRT